jgi:hypothetical protein
MQLKHAALSGPKRRTQVPGGPRWHMSFHFFPNVFCLCAYSFTIVLQLTS